MTTKIKAPPFRCPLCSDDTRDQRAGAIPEEDTIICRGCGFSTQRKHWERFREKDRPKHDPELDCSYTGCTSGLNATVCEECVEARVSDARVQGRSDHPSFAATADVVESVITTLEKGIVAKDRHGAYIDRATVVDMIAQLRAALEQGRIPYPTVGEIGSTLAMAADQMIRLADEWERLEIGNLVEPAQAMRGWAYAIKQDPATERPSTITPEEVQAALDKPPDPTLRENLDRVFRTAPSNVRLRSNQPPATEPEGCSRCAGFDELHRDGELVGLSRPHSGIELNDPKAVESVAQGLADYSNTTVRCKCGAELDFDDDEMDREIVVEPCHACAAAHIQEGVDSAQDAQPTGPAGDAVGEVVEEMRRGIAVTSVQEYAETAAERIMEWADRLAGSGEAETHPEVGAIADELDQLGHDAAVGQQVRYRAYELARKVRRLQPGPAKVAEVQQWEHKQESSLNIGVKRCLEQGKDGWQICGVTGSAFIFKRPIPGADKAKCDDSTGKSTACLDSDFPPAWCDLSNRLDQVRTDFDIAQSDLKRALEDASEQNQRRQELAMRQLEATTERDAARADRDAWQERARIAKEARRQARIDLDVERSAHEETRARLAQCQESAMSTEDDCAYCEETMEEMRQRVAELEALNNPALR